MGLICKSAFPTIFFFKCVINKAYLQMIVTYYLPNAPLVVSMISGYALSEWKINEETKTIKNVGGQ